jgi:hypothetical protein
MMRYHPCLTYMYFSFQIPKFIKRKTFNMEWTLNCKTGVSVIAYRF